MTLSADLMELREEDVRRRYPSALALLQGFDHAPRIAAGAAPVPAPAPEPAPEPAPVPVPAPALTSPPETSVIPTAATSVIIRITILRSQVSRGP